MKQSTFANGLARKILVLFASASMCEGSSKPSLFACIEYGRRGRLSLSIRLLIALDTPEWAFNGGILAYAISTKTSCAGQNKVD